MQALTQIPVNCPDEHYSCSPDVLRATALPGQRRTASLVRTSTSSSCPERKHPTTITPILASIGARSAPGNLCQPLYKCSFLSKKSVIPLNFLHLSDDPKSACARADRSDSEGEEEVEVPALWEVVVWMTPRMGGCC